MIPSLDPGITVHVRNRQLAGERYAPERIVLFVHGATFPLLGRTAPTASQRAIASCADFQRR